MKNIIIRGLLIGLTAGLIATLFDSLYMLLPETYVPYKYPFLIIITNICFSTITGVVSGFFVYLFTRKEHNFQEKESFYWLIFFLLPFALLIGFMGKFNDKKILNPGFDHNLVFLWVFIFIISVIAIKKKFPWAAVGSGFFIPELFTITALFHFCSNIAQLPVVQESFGCFFTVDFFKDNKRWMQLYNRFCMVLYAAGVLLILSLYYLASSKFKISRIRLAPSLIALFSAAAVLLTLCYRANRSEFLEQYYSVAGMQSREMHKKGPPVILIVLDTLRKRSVDMHSGVFTNLQAFARDSLVFERCIANSCWTIPSHASLFTGFSPREHGAHHILKSRPWFDGFPPPRRLSNDFTTLAEVFKANGYRTAAVVSNFMALNKGYNLNQGFQLYDWSKSIGCIYTELPVKPLLHFINFMTNLKNKYTLPYRKAEDINDSVYSLLQGLAPEPFFLFVNYMDAHEPYRPSPPFLSHFSDVVFPNISLLIKKVFYHFRFVSKETIGFFNKLLYKGEIAYLDHHLGKLFEHLKKLGIYDDALIIITSDHGELFYEHGYEGHRVPLYEGVTHIPLFIKFPHEQVTGSEQQHITLADLYPTILSICGLPVPEGIPAKPFGKPAEPVVAEFYNYDIGAHRALHNGKHKFMQFEMGKEPELYDLEADPLETKNIAKMFPKATVNMQDMLTKWVKNHLPRYTTADRQKIELSPGIKEDLKTLGYIQ